MVRKCLTSVMRDREERPTRRTYEVVICDALPRKTSGEKMMHGRRKSGGRL
uniref:Uncharacterized protein n=1 Tax=Cucumis melo TaxID=3656 RepID=A0A9I9CUM7_CUCME